MKGYLILVWVLKWYDTLGCYFGTQIRRSTTPELLFTVVGTCRETEVNRERGRGVALRKVFYWSVGGFRDEI